MEHVHQIACDNLLFCYRKVLDALNRSTKQNSSEREELFKVFWEEYKASGIDNGISTSILTLLLTIYITLILFGAFGSGLVMFVILRKQSMRSRGNLFILNLAISDLTLCLFTQPFNLLRLLTGYRNWMLGQFMCKFSATFQGTNVFVSTISITAIALDRFQCIIHPTISRQNTQQTFRILYTAWIGSFILASPLAYFSRTLELSKIQCVEIAEDSNTQLLKVIYSIGALILQYIAPLLIVSVSYSRICFRIHDRYMEMSKRYHSRPIEIVLTKSDDNNITSRQETQTHNIFSNSTGCKAPGLNSPRLQTCRNFRHSNEKHRIVNRRHRKAILLLTAIAIVFSLSWLPLNLMNVIIDFRSLSILKSLTVINSPQNITNRFTKWNIGPANANFLPFKKIGHSDQFRRTPINELEPQTVTILQFIFLLLILSSACLNPILYGWLNENFRIEFRDVLKQQSYLLHFCRLCWMHNNQNQSPADEDLRCPTWLASEYDHRSKNRTHLLKETYPIAKRGSQEMKFLKTNLTNISQSLDSINKTDDVIQRISRLHNVNCSHMEQIIVNPEDRKGETTDLNLNIKGEYILPSTPMTVPTFEDSDSISEIDDPMAHCTLDNIYSHEWLSSV